MNQRHVVIAKGQDGEIQSFPMKKWLRENPSVLEQLDPSDYTSHQLRNFLTKKGWTVQDSPSEFRLISPLISNSEIEEQAASLDAESAESTSEDPDSDSDLAFELEHQLQDFILANLSSIRVNERRLTLFHDQNGRSGREYPTDVGRIDILAQDDKQNLYVFELKRAKTADHTIGQVLRYMGWLHRHVANGREVHGVIVAKALSETVKYAILAVKNVTAFEYSVTFQLHNAEFGDS